MTLHRPSRRLAGNFGERKGAPASKRLSPSAITSPYARHPFRLRLYPACLRDATGIRTYFFPTPDANCFCEVSLTCTTRCAGGHATTLSFNGGRPPFLTFPSYSLSKRGASGVPILELNQSGSLRERDLLLRSETVLANAKKLLRLVSAYVPTNKTIPMVPFVTAA